MAPLEPPPTNNAGSLEAKVLVVDDILRGYNIAIHQLTDRHLATEAVEGVITGAVAALEKHKNPVAFV